jgi:methylenetetrahydrofolate dehydrogenase (NADP+)/methenyltetrahydrofolate cyclohydrolase
MTTLAKTHTVILDGTKRATEIKQELTQQINATKKNPELAAILVGEDKASALYIKLKEKACQEIGITFHKYLSTPDCSPGITEKELVELIAFLNQDEAIDGILLQLPLPKTFDTDKVISAIDPRKDVDGFLPKQTTITPPTIASIIELLQMTGENLTHKKTLVVANSDIFLQKIKSCLNAELELDVISVTKIPENSRDYEIIIIALGQAHILKKSMVQENTIVIDVGINTVDGKTVGDVDPEVAEVAGYLSPVPGGVGPLTVACLLRNTYILSQK